MNKETLRMQMLASVITESEYKAIINKEIEEADKKSLKESMIGGIVGIQAINTIPPREKTDYEMAFEHFLSERYEKEEAKETTLPPSPDENSSIIQLMRNLLASGVAIDGVPTDIENVSDEELYKIAQQYMMKQTHSK
jgi:hypothetical protein